MDEHSNGDIPIQNVNPSTEDNGACDFSSPDKGDHLLPNQDPDDGCSVMKKNPDVDQGWAWVILAATFTSLFTVGFFMVGFAAFYVDIVDRFDSDYGTIGWIGSMQSFTGNFLGVIIGAFIQRFGCRVIGICGALLGTAGIALCYFMVSVPYLYVMYGLIAGIGNGLCFTSSLVIIQHYFDKKRTLANGISTTGIAIGWLLSAPIIKALIRNYGISGTFLITSGIWLNNMVCACLYRPQKSTERPNQSVVRDIFDFSVLKNIKLDLYLLTNLLMYIGSMGFFGHYISWLTKVDLDPDLVVVYQVVMYGCLVVSRLTFSFGGNRPWVDRVLALSLVILFGGCVITGSSAVHSDAGAIICSVMYGVFSGGCFALQLTVLVDVCGLSQIAKTTGFLNMAASVARLIGIPLTGYIYDVTGTYTIPLLVIGIFHTCAGLVLLISCLVTKYQNRSLTTDVPATQQQADISKL